MHVKSLKPTKIKTAIFIAPADTDLQKVENAENISFILYLIPLVLSTFYAVFLWISEGLSFTLPQTVYLTVTKDPYIFLIGFLAICLAVLVEIFLSPEESKLIKLTDNARQIQFLAFICIGSVIVSVWSTSGYSLNLGQFLQILLGGRYALIFPLMLFIFSLILNPKLQINILSTDTLIKYTSIFLLIASPLIFYGLWSIHVPWESLISITLITLIFGSALLFYRGLDQIK